MATTFIAMRERRRSGAAHVVALVAAVIVAIAMAGCATSARPLPTTKRVALTPPPDEIAVSARVGKPIGEIVPVDVSVANGTDEPYLVDSTQVFAIDEDGERILPVPPAEAVQEAGNANSLKAGLTGAGKNAAVGALTGAVVGAALGAGAGALVGVPPVGAALGAAIGGGVGAASAGAVGGMQGQAAAYNDAATQISALCLKSQEAHPKYLVNGYVFFPKGSYKSVQLTLLNRETEQARTMTAPLLEQGAHAPQPGVRPLPAKPPGIDSQDTE
jgi:hypothetical protein